MGKRRRKAKKATKRVAKAIKKVSIHGEIHKMIRVTKKKGLRRKSVRGYQLQTYGRLGLGRKKGWMNVVGSFRKTMSDMNKYIGNLKKARH